MNIINVTVIDKGIAILEIMLQPQYFFLRNKKSIIGTDLVCLLVV